MSERLRVIGYVRVSTQEQAASGYGLAAQESAIRAAVERNNWDLIAITRDEGASGKDLNRPGIREALAMVHEADSLIVAKLDRLTRSLVGLSDLLDWGKRNGLGLIALDLGLDTSTETGRLVARIMASVGEWERERIAERTRQAAAVRRAQGRQMGRPGVRDTMPEVAQLISDLRGQGQTWQQIADRLNADGVPTVRGGSQWRVSAVQSAAGYVRPASQAKRVDLPDAPRRRARAKRKEA
ncbi:recombinase family protein [Micromonospora costi]|uniref:recombinase family protein n=1 Tax=Micromonospora costi TaxID=1530042 RepID=UPI0033D31A30